MVGDLLLALSKHVLQTRDLLFEARRRPLIWGDVESGKGNRKGRSVRRLRRATHPMA